MSNTTSVFRIRELLTGKLLSARISGSDIAEILKAWSYRIRTRRHLAAMDSYLLADIGLTAEDAMTEARQPFWKPVCPHQSGLGLRR
mgnify:FL=1